MALEKILLTCRVCGSDAIRKNGRTKSGIQKYYCSSCGK